MDAPETLDRADFGNEMFVAYMAWRTANQIVPGVHWREPFNGTGMTIYRAFMNHWALMRLTRNSK